MSGKDATPSGGVVGTSLLAEWRNMLKSAEGWGAKATAVAALPVFVAAWIFIPGPYDCPGCGTELRGRGDNCPECGYAFTEKGHLKNIEQEVNSDA